MQKKWVKIHLIEQMTLMLPNFAKGNFLMLPKVIDPLAFLQCMHIAYPDPPPRALLVHHSMIILQCAFVHLCNRKKP